jgi:BolA protein
MTIQAEIHEKLLHAFSPTHIELTNESHMHNVPTGSESHFKVVVVSALFEGKMLIARHRLVNKALAEEIEGKIHALALHTLTPAEWAAKEGNTLKSPPCHGGSAND